MSDKNLTKNKLLATSNQSKEPLIIDTSFDQDIITVQTPLVGLNISSSIIHRRNNIDHIDINKAIYNNSEDKDKLPENFDNIFYENIHFNFKLIEDLVTNINFSNIKTDKEMLENIFEVEKIVLMKIKYSRHKWTVTKFQKSIWKEMSFKLFDDKVRDYNRIRLILEQIRIIRDQYFNDLLTGKIKLVEEEDERMKKWMEDNWTQRNEGDWITNGQFFKTDNNHQIKSKTVPFKESKDKKINFQDPIWIKRKSIVSTMKDSIILEDKNEISETVSILKYYYKKYFNWFKERLESRFNVENFPWFWIREIQCKWKRKVNSMLIPKFKEMYLKYNFYNSFEYLIVDKFINKIVKEEMEIFDQNVLTTRARECLLKIVMCNLSTIFLDTSYVSGPILINFAKIYSSKMKIDPDWSFLDSLNTISISDLFNELNHTIVSGQEINTYLFCVLSLILTLKNYDIINKTVNESEYQTRENECLSNTLMDFNNYSLIENLNFWKFGQVLTSSLFSVFFKHQYAEIFTDMDYISNSGSSTNTRKKIIDVTNESFNLAKDKIPFMNINNKISRCYSDKLINGYFEFLSNLPQKKQKNCCQKFGAVWRDFFIPYKEKKTHINLGYTRLIPYDKCNSSSQACIIIHGYIATHQNLYTQWENFILDFDLYVDFYFYTWDSKTLSKIAKDILKFLGGLSLTILTRNFLKVFQVYRTYQHKNNLFAKTTKISSYAGKFLAYILASKAFFPHKSITLVGFSLGAHVIKHTLKELHKISLYLPEVKSIIQNIVYIGGATYFPKDLGAFGNIRDFVAGRIINCFNPDDEVLTGIFRYIIKREPIGISPLLMDEKIENYDFSDLKIKHVEYWDYSNILIKKMNLF